MCSILLYKTNKLGAIIVLLSSLLCSYEYDLITNISRGHISGFIFAFIGSFLLIYRKTTPLYIYIGIISMFVGYIASLQSVLISFLGLIYCLLRDKEIFKNKKEIFISFILGLALVYYCDYLFYAQNPEYNLHDAYSASLSFNVFIENIKNMFRILSYYSLFSYKNIPASLFLICLALFSYLIKNKNYRMLILATSGLLFFIFTLFFEKTQDFNSSLLFSQNRLFLFVPYLILFILFVLFKENKKDFKANIFYFIVVICIITSLFKTYFLNNYLYKNQKYINISQVVSIENSKLIFYMADMLKKITKEHNIKTVVFVGDENRALCYSASALNYDNYVLYLATYDRRTPIYLHFKNNILNNEKVLFVQSIQGVPFYYIENIDSITLIDYIYKEYGLLRK